MTTLPSKILVAVESAEFTTVALEAIAGIAKTSEATVDLVHIWEPLPFTPPDAAYLPEAETRSYAEASEKHSRDMLHRVSQAAEEQGLKVGATHTRCGHPASEILAVAKEGAADWIVLSSHKRHGLSRWFMGSVSEKVTAHAQCPVLTVPGPPQP